MNYKLYALTTMAFVFGMSCSLYSMDESPSDNLHNVTEPTSECQGLYKKLHELFLAKNICYELELEGLFDSKTKKHCNEIKKLSKNLAFMLAMTEADWIC